MGNCCFSLGASKPFPGSFQTCSSQNLTFYFSCHCGFGGSIQGGKRQEKGGWCSCKHSEAITSPGPCAPFHQQDQFPSHSHVEKPSKDYSWGRRKEKAIAASLLWISIRVAQLIPSFMPGGPSGWAFIIRTIFPPQVCMQGLQCKPPSFSLQMNVRCLFSLSLPLPRQDGLCSVWGIGGTWD